MKLGTIDIEKIYVGSNEIEKGYVGSSVVYEENSGPDYSEPFYVEDISGSSNTLTIKRASSSAPALTIYKSTDKVNWTSMGTTSQNGITATVPANGKLYLRCSTNAWGAESTYYYHYINCSYRFNLGGNIMSLLYGSSFTGEERTFPSSNTYVFKNMFYAAKVVSAKKLLLPATILTQRCYQSMFYGCTSLTTAPELPATTLANYCYASMFQGCTALITVPVILPATTLAEYCYSRMFSGCTSLTTAPELPATTLAKGSYMYMYIECTSLNYIKVGFSTWPSTSSSASDYDATHTWTNLTKNTTGTFVCPAALPQKFNASGNNTAGSSISGYTNAIPYGWTVQTF